MRSVGIKLKLLFNGLGGYMSRRRGVGMKLDLLRVVDEIPGLSFFEGADGEMDGVRLLLMG
jgi:hypothetical protein